MKTLIYSLAVLSLLALPAHATKDKARIQPKPIPPPAPTYLPIGVIGQTQPGGRIVFKEGARGGECVDRACGQQTAAQNASEAVLEKRVVDPESALSHLPGFKVESHTEQQANKETSSMDGLSFKLSSLESEATDFKTGSLQIFMDVFGSNTSDGGKLIDVRKVVATLLEMETFQDNFTISAIAMNNTSEKTDLPAKLVITGHTGVVGDKESFDETSLFKIPPPSAQNNQWFMGPTFRFEGQK